MPNPEPFALKLHALASTPSAGTAVSDSERDLEKNDKHAFASLGSNHFEHKNVA